MTTTNARIAATDQNKLIYEEKPSGLMWVAFVAIALVIALLEVAGLSADKGVGGWVLVVAGYLGIAFSLYIAVIAFRGRREATLYYGDRVEVRHDEEVIRQLPYEAAENVAYGFRSEGKEQVLSFTGPGREPFFQLRYNAAVADAGESAMTEDKLVEIRDLLYESVAARMVNAADSAVGAKWFDQLRLSRDGLYVGDELCPWSQVSIDANESNGRLVVSRGGKVVARTMMTADDIIPGLMASERLRA